MPGEAITLERLRAGQMTVAKLVAQNEAYLPIFLRLEEEIAKAENPQPNALQRALAMAAQSETPTC